MSPKTSPAKAGVFERWPIVALSEDIKTQSKRMSIGALSDKVTKAASDCGDLNIRLAHLSANPQLYAAEIAAVVRQRDEACLWSSVGASELARRQMEESGRKAQQAAAARPPSRRKEEEEEEEEEEEGTPLPEPASSWPWIAGAAAVGLGVLTVLGLRRPAVVRYVKAIPAKAQKAVKKMR